MFGKCYNVSIKPFKTLPFIHFVSGLIKTKSRLINKRLFISPARLVRSLERQTGGSEAI
jgi:hypothetical protein